MKLVLVDIDGTLVRNPSSERRFYRHLREQRRIGLGEALAFAGFTLRYLARFGYGVFRKNKAYVAGIGESEVRELADEFVSNSLVHAFFEPACARVRRHLQVGDEVWLLSGTLEYIADSVARHLRLEHVVATRCVSENGVLLSRPPQVHPYGTEKLELARSICQQQGIGLADVVAYADSWADRFLMEAVGRPVAVMPDRRLRELAGKRGWEIIEADGELVAAPSERGA